MSTAEKIIILRKYLNLSQAALGSRIGFTPTYISSMERGKVEVLDEVIEKILKEFGIQEFDFEKYKINAEDSKPLEKFALRLKNLRKSMGIPSLSLQILLAVIEAVYQSWRVSHLS